MHAIAEALDEMEREMQTADHQPLSGDRLFHLRIAEATGNGALVAVVKMLWEERTGALYKQLEHHYDSPALWETAMAEHRAVLKAIVAQRPDGGARRDAAAPQPGVQAVFHGLGHAVADAARGARQCSPAASTPRKTCASNPSTSPTAGPGEVLLRLGAAGICGSDLHYYFEGRNGSFVVREPLIPGHEASGVVAGVGAGVTRVKAGDKVAVVAVARLRPLRLLPRGPRAPVHATCASWAAPACFPHVQGMFQEYFVMGERQCYPVAGDVSLGELAFAEPLAVGAARASTAAAICSASRC